METSWLMDETNNGENNEDRDPVFIPMVRFKGTQQRHTDGSMQDRATPRSNRYSRVYTPLQDEETFFPVDETSWKYDNPRPVANNRNSENPDNIELFAIDENAWTMSGTYSETTEPFVAVEGRDGKVLFSLQRHESTGRIFDRPRSLNLQSLASLSSGGFPPRSFSTQSSQISVDSKVNLGFMDLDDGSSLVNHRFIKFEHDTAMLFRSLSRPQQKSKKPWHRLLTVWWDSLLALCCSCCKRRSSWRCTCSCRDEKGVHFVQMAKKKILKHLLLVQVVISVMAIVLSGMVFFPLGFNFRSFNDQCLLYADIKLTPKTEDAGVKIDLSNTFFGNVEECNYTTFLNVVVAIASVIFLWFFYHNHSLESSEQSEVKLQLPVLLVHLGLLVCVMVSSCKITLGFKFWCDKIGYTGDSKSNLHCREYETLSWDSTSRSFDCPFYIYNLLAEASSWLLALTLLLQCVVTSVKLYQDFVATFQETEVPHKKLDEQSDTDSLCLERGLTNVGSDEFVCTEIRLSGVEKYNPETKRQQLAEAIVHQNILAMATGDQLPSKTDNVKPIVLDTESFKQKSRARKHERQDLVDGVGEVEPTRPHGKKTMIELGPMALQGATAISKSSINSESDDFEVTGEEEASDDGSRRKENKDYMNSRNCPDGQW